MMIRKTGILAAAAAGLLVAGCAIKLTTKTGKPEITFPAPAPKQEHKAMEEATTPSLNPQGSSSDAPAPEENALKTSRFQISGSGCCWDIAVKEKLLTLKGVASVEIDSGGKAKVRHDPAVVTASQISDVINGLGYGAQSLD